MEQKKKTILIICSVLAVGGFGSLLSAEQSRPNVLLILSDDMGYSDLPKFGKSEIPTPNIDRLANEGTLFTDAYVTAPICVASRMGLLSGQYQQRFGIYDNIYGADKTRLFLQQTLLPAVFQNAGYRTAHVGKWHLSGNKRLQYETAGPRDRGFDESVAIRGGGLGLLERNACFSQRQTVSSSGIPDGSLGN